MDTKLKKPLIVIVGPTASGKTDLAVELAERIDGEIICADSRTVYRHFDIGTAKPSAELQKRVPHHLLDTVEPDDLFTAKMFKDLATATVSAIRSKGKVPILVGGTGLYIDSVVFDYEFGVRADMSNRQEFEKMSVEQLQDYCKKFNIPLPENDKNKRYLIRAIEQGGVNTRRRDEPLKNTLIVGITMSDSELRLRIQKRANQLFHRPVIDEAKRLAQAYGWDAEPMKGNIYRLIRRHVEGELTHEELIEKFITSDWRLARRQRTWFKRNRYIRWGSAEQIRQAVLDFVHRQNE